MTDDQLRAKLISERGLDISYLGPDAVERVLDSHVERAGCSGIADYVGRLDSDYNEYQSLVSDLVALPQRFSGDSHLISLLGHHVLPEILKRKPPGEHVRVWIPNSGRGYLAYDVALLLRELVSRKPGDRTVRIFATGTDPEALSAARRMAYTDDEVRELSSLEEPARHGSRVLAKVRQSVVFGVHDLASQVVYSQIDLLLCIGALPLLDSEKRARVVAKLVHSLGLGGVLVLGRGETAAIDLDGPSAGRPFGTFTKLVSRPFELATAVSTGSVGLARERPPINTLDEPVLIVNRSKYVMEANQAALDALGASPGLVGWQLGDIEPRALFSSVVKAVDHAAGTGASTQIQPVMDWVGGVTPAEGGSLVVCLTECESCSGENSTGHHGRCTTAALEMAGLIAHSLGQRAKLDQVTRQAALITENLFNRTEDLNRTTDDLSAANSRLKHEAAELAKAEEALREAYKREHYIAGTLQSALLPPLVERVDGFRIASRYRAAFVEAEVGGDFYHGAPLGEGKYLLALGDVAGKGLHAALLGSLTKHMMMGFASETAAPDITLMRLNDALIAHVMDFGFVTLVYALLDVTSHTLYYSSAGHEPLIHYRAGAGEAVLLAPTGRALGIAADARYEVGEVVMESGDLLFAYTDGLVDAGVPDRPLGPEGLCELTERFADEPPCHILDMIYETATGISGGKLKDDAAGIMLKREV